MVDPIIYSFSVKMRVVNRSFGSTAGVGGNTGEPKATGTAKIPRGLRRLPIVATTTTNTRSEFDRLKAEAAQIEQWWSTPRFKHTKRVYSGA